MSDELAKAEDWMRTLAEHGIQGRAAVFMREFDRLKSVEKAAAALVERWGNGDFRVGPVGNALLTALTDALNGETT